HPQQLSLSLDSESADIFCVCIVCYCIVGAWRVSVVSVEGCSGVSGVSGVSEAVRGPASRSENNDAAGMAMAVGLAGYQYGSPAVHVQLFVESAFQTFLKDQSASGGASGTALVAFCRLTQSECFLSVERVDGRGNQSEDDLDGPIVFMKPATNGCHMAKLSSLSVLAERLLRTGTASRVRRDVARRCPGRIYGGPSILHNVRQVSPNLSRRL
ncbi:hypothetical protein THAOC_06523, partial [Thalassiosira oceanica]